MKIGPILKGAADHHSMGKLNGHPGIFRSLICGEYRTPEDVQHPNKMILGLEHIYVIKSRCSSIPRS